MSRVRRKTNNKKKNQDGSLRKLGFCPCWRTAVKWAENAGIIWCWPDIKWSAYTPNDSVIVPISLKSASRILPTLPRSLKTISNASETDSRSHTMWSRCQVEPTITHLLHGGEFWLYLFDCLELVFSLAAERSLALQHEIKKTIKILSKRTKTDLNESVFRTRRV